MFSTSACLQLISNSCILLRAVSDHLPYFWLWLEAISNSRENFLSTFQTLRISWKKAPLALVVFQRVSRCLRFLTLHLVFDIVNKIKMFSCKTVLEHSMPRTRAWNSNSKKTKLIRFARDYKCNPSLQHLRELMYLTTAGMLSLDDLPTLTV